MSKIKLPTITFNRWFSFVFGLLMSSVSGVSYMFGALAPPLKEQMGYTQYQINMVGTMANIGGNLGVIGSLFYNYFGTRPSCLLAGILIFVGYFLIYGAAMKWFWVSYIMMGVFFMVMQNGTATAYTAALSTNIVNYSQRSRGIVIGSMASVLAISSAIFTSIYTYVFKKELNPFLLFMAIAAGSIPTVSTIFMNVIPDKNKQASSSSAKNYSDDDDEKDHLNIQHGPVRRHYDSTSDSDLEAAQPVLYQSTYGTDISPLIVTDHAQLGPVAVPSSDGDDNRKRVIVTKDMIFMDVNPFQMLISLDFWLLFVVFFSSVGSAYVINNNLGSIVLSLGAQKGAQNIMVLLFSFANCLGRIIVGLVSDKIANYVTRMTILNFATLGIGLIHYGFSFSTVPAMHFWITVLGLVYGALYAMIPSFISERFGPKYFSINFNVACLAPSLGSYLLATLLASSVYKANSREGSNSCFGRGCFQATHLICTGLCVFSFIVGLFLMHRSSRMYTRIQAYNKKFGGKKLVDSEEEEKGVELPTKQAVTAVVVSSMMIDR